MKIHLLQSEEWEKFEKLEGKETFRLKGDGYEALAVLNETPVGNYLMVPYGPALEGGFGADFDTAQAGSALKNALIGLQELAGKHKCFMVRIEPTLALTRDVMQNTANEAGLSIVKTKHIEPEHTWVLDLAPDETALMDVMESNKTRKWRNFAKKGMTIRKTQDTVEIGVLTRLLAEVGEEDHFTPQDEDHLRRQLEAGFATLYIAELANEEKDDAPIAIAAVLVYDYDGVRYYAHAAADYEHRRLQAGSILLIETIIDAKRAGMAKYDFWGITISGDPSDPWYGFTQYKKSFGGEQVDYAGTYDLIVSASKYRLYGGLRKANLAVRKLKK